MKTEIQINCGMKGMKTVAADVKKGWAIHRPLESWVKSWVLTHEHTGLEAARFDRHAGARAARDRLVAANLKTDRLAVVTRRHKGAAVTWHVQDPDNVRPLISAAIKGNG